MTFTADRLAALLPTLYRLRDEERGRPLHALLEAFAGELAALEENIEQLYDDQFIETCADWVVPYIGDLIGYRPLHGVAPKISAPRSEVANTIRFRRRKGTALMLEEMATDVTDWPAHAVEFFEQLATTQYMKHIRLYAPATPDLRDTRRMLQRDTAFNAVAHTAEMRRPELASGRYNIPNIGLFLWRIRPRRLNAVDLVPDPGDATGRRFRLNPLGADLRLFRKGQTESDISHLAESINVPEPLSVRLMALDVRAAQAGINPAPDDNLDDDYGPTESVVLLRNGAPLSVSEIRIADLRDTPTGWNHEATIEPGSVAIDPERGRVLLGEVADGPLTATFHYGSARDIGGGDYARSPEGDDLAPQRSASNSEALQPGLDAIAGGGRLSIEDSLTYTETPTIAVDGVVTPGESGLTVVVAAIDGVRPLIAASGDLTLDIGERGRLVLDGLVISGGTLRLASAPDTEPRELILRDCTLVPGLTLNTDGSAVSSGTPSLIVENSFAKGTLERCITVPLQVVADAELILQDTVVDAGGATSVAIDGDGTGTTGPQLTAHECTIIGEVHSRLIQLASNTIFLGKVNVERRQDGCVRFCYVPRGSIVPRRFRCVPDDVNPNVEPHFTSLRYGDAAYCQLKRVTPTAIRTGASDEGEIGVMHALFQPQRETNLRIRLEEYLRLGLRAGIFFAT